MNAPCLPEPFEDEILPGYLGRCCAMHGCSSVKTMITGLYAHFQLSSGKSVKDAVAAGLGITAPEVLTRLTTLPAQRAFAAHQTDKGAQSTVQLSVTGVQLRSSSEALACERCAQDDAKEGRPSYWRRAHHLPGVDWCPVHQTALIQFEPSAFERCPSDALTHGAGVRCSLPLELDGSSVLGRYTALLVQWLSRRSIGNCAALTQVLRDGCTLHGLRWGQVGIRPPASDFIKQQVPTEWLSLYWPQLLNKRLGDYLPRLDGPCKDKHVGYPGATCALVLAALFDSVDNIQQRLEGAEARLAEDCIEWNEQAFCAARDDFLGGASLAAACRANNFSIELMEQWLRGQTMQGGALPAAVPKKNPHQRQRHLPQVGAAVH